MTSGVQKMVLIQTIEFLGEIWTIFGEISFGGNQMLDGACGVELVFPYMFEVPD